LISPDAYQSSAAARRYVASDGGLPRGRRCVVSAFEPENPAADPDIRSQAPSSHRARSTVEVVESRYFLNQVRPDSWINVKVRLSPWVSNWDRSCSTRLSVERCDDAFESITLSSGAPNTVVREGEPKL